MTTRVIHTRADADMLCAQIKTRDLPVTVTVVDGVKRSTKQNRLQRQWVGEIARQSSDTRDPEWWRGYVKLRFGIPIRYRDDEVYAERVGRMLEPLTYDQRIECMMQPIDLPVTRDMVAAQKREYLDAVFQFFTEQGFVLTHPDDRKWEAFA